MSKWEKMSENNTVTVCTVPSDFMEQMTSRMCRMERDIRRTRRTCAVVLVLCAGLAYDIYKYAINGKKDTKEKPGD